MSNTEQFKTHALNVWKALPWYKRAFWTVCGKRPTEKRLNAVVDQIKAEQALMDVALDGLDFDKREN